MSSRSPIFTQELRIARPGGRAEPRQHFDDNPGVRTRDPRAFKGGKPLVTCKRCLASRIADELKKLGIPYTEGDWEAVRFEGQFNQLVHHLRQLTTG